MPLYAPISANGVPGGTSFPLSPSNNDLFYRTDRDIIYFYDGTRWVSTALFSLTLNPDAIQPQTSTAGHRSASPFAGQYDIYCEKFVVSSYNSSATSANYFTVQLGTEPGGATIGSAISLQNKTQNTWVVDTLTINQTIASSIGLIQASATETGTASTFISCSILYRIIG